MRKNLSKSCCFSISAEYLHICHKSNANLTECLKASIEKFQTVLFNGIPNEDIPGIDPLQLGRLFSAEKNRHGLNIKVKNLLILGISKFKITDLK